MTPAESLAALDLARKQPHAAERTALTVLALDWLTRAREAFPTPDGAIEEHTPIKWIADGHRSFFMRVVTELVKVTPAGGVRIRQTSQSTRIRVDNATEIMGPISAPTVRESTHAGNTRDGQEWREKFAKGKT